MLGVATIEADPGRGNANDSAITTINLTKTFGRRTVVDAINIEVEAGEIFGFLGPNGAGKTTTMRMLLGLVQPSSGSARMLGMDIATQMSKILRRTGSIIETPTFYPFLSGRDNLRVIAKLTETPGKRINEVLATVDLIQAGKRKYKRYSLGMKQRLAVAAALMRNPSLLILDEPANGLDPAGIVEMRKLMMQLKSEGKTVLISSHVLHEVEQICDRIAILNHGRLVVEGRVDELLTAGNQIELVVSDPERAASILRGLGWVSGVTQSQNRLLITAAASRSWELNQILAEQGLYASEIKPSEATLEQYFLGMTRGGAPQ